MRAKTPAAVGIAIVIAAVRIAPVLADEQEPTSTTSRAAADNYPRAITPSAASPTWRSSFASGSRRSLNGASPGPCPCDFMEVTWLRSPVTGVPLGFGIGGSVAAGPVMVDLFANFRFPVFAAFADGESDITTGFWNLIFGINLYTPVLF